MENERIYIVLPISLQNVQEIDLNINFVTLRVKRQKETDILSL